MPEYFGSAICRTDVGSWLELIRLGLYTNTLTRADTPTQSPAGELYLVGVSESVDGVTDARSPLPCRYSSAGEFSVKITSAGEWLPSTTIWFARVSSSSLRTFTVIPVALSNADTRAWVVCTCWPL